MRIRIALLCFWSIILFSNQSIAKHTPKIVIQNYECRIEFDTVNNYFRTSYRICGKSLAQGETYSIYYNDLERISNLKVSYYKNGKLTKLTNKEFYQVKVSDASFYSGIKNSSFVIPYTEGNKNDFIITYDKITSEHKLFTEFPFYSAYNIDTIKYSVNIPLYYQLHYSHSDCSTVKDLKIDSSFSSTKQYYFSKTNIGNIIEKLEKKD